MNGRFRSLSVAFVRFTAHTPRVLALGGPSGSVVTPTKSRKGRFGWYLRALAGYARAVGLEGLCVLQAVAMAGLLEPRAYPGRRPGPWTSALGVRVLDAPAPASAVRGGTGAVGIVIGSVRLGCVDVAVPSHRVRSRNGRLCGKQNKQRNNEAAPQVHCQRD